MSTSTDDAVVALGAGRVRGRRRGSVAEFLGIRYAEAARFAPPVPVPPGPGTHDAVEHGPIAPQLAARVAEVTGPSTDDGAPQDEDCLRVDVRVPVAALADGVPRPVVVWLHGGAYVIGSAATGWYDTARLVEEGDVVAVSVGYRLGVLGWLREAGVSEGNLGLLDVLAALRWVAEHVGAFGGDPDRVTLMGQSAGAHTIACLMTVPTARPLFRRAILQSGQLGLGLSSSGRAARIAGYVRDALDGADPATADVDALLRAQRTAMIRAAGPGGLDSSPAFAPVDGVAPLAAGTTWSDAAVSGHDLLIGSTADEAETFVRISPALWRMRRTPLVGWFAGFGSAAATHRVFGAPAMRLADRATRAGSGVYSYRFDWRAPRSALGACHCIELPFLFGARSAWRDAPMLAGASWDDDVEPLGAALRAACLGFVRDGDPRADEAPPWPRHTPGGGPTMVLDSSTSRSPRTDNGHTR